LLECQLRGLIADQDDLERIILEYCQRQLYTDSNVSQTLAQLSTSLHNPESIAAMLAGDPMGDDSAVGHTLSIANAKLASQRLPSVDDLIEVRAFKSLLKGDDTTIYHLD
jgi:hypothetical protein